jgi:DNA-binding HxlR family transcriptional regulator
MATLVTMSGRSYSQYCAMARALDVLGERWSLLVVRELLDGPRRYGDLLAGLRTISTDILARRLRELEDAGVVERVDLPPPASSRVYRLTERGRAVEPILGALAAWGTDLLASRGDGESADIRWVARAVRLMAVPGRSAEPLTVRFVTPEGTTVVRIDGDDVREPAAGGDVDGDVDVVVEGTMETLGAALDPERAGRLIASGALRIDGSDEARRRFAALFAPLDPAR